MCTEHRGNIVTEQSKKDLPVSDSVPEDTGPLVDPSLGDYGEPSNSNSTEIDLQHAIDQIL